MMMMISLLQLASPAPAAPAAPAPRPRDAHWHWHWGRRQPLESEVLFVSHEPDGGERWSAVAAEYAAGLESRLRAYDDAIARLESDAEALVFGEGEGRYRAASAAAKLARVRRATEHGWRANLRVLARLREGVNATGKFVASKQLQRGALALAGAGGRAGGGAGAGGGGGQYRYESVEQLFVHLVRDYSTAGAPTRAEAHRPLLDAVRRFVPGCRGNGARTRSTGGGGGGGAQGHRRARVLVPGAGLGRLGRDLYLLCGGGLDVEANEVSYVLASAAHTLWQRCGFEHGGGGSLCRFDLHPHVATMANVVSSTLRHAATVAVDDHRHDALHPRHTTEYSRAGGRGPGTLSMRVGDFATLYGQGPGAPGHAGANCQGGGGSAGAGCFDAVVTCFFIDTQVSTLDAVATIARVLPVGGIWSNLGPLAYHHDAGLRPSVDELLALVGVMFDVVEHRIIRDVAYHPEQHRRARLQRNARYDCLFMVARKI